jgi:hypothetical protein
MKGTQGVNELGNEHKSPPFEGGDAERSEAGVVPLTNLTTPPARKARRHPSFKRRGIK